MKVKQKILWAVVIFFCQTASCSDDDKKDSRAICDRLTSNIGIQTDCTGTLNSTMSNIQYGAYNHMISLHFHITCSNSNEEYEGDITNIQYNNYGEVLSYDATINGVHCHYPN